MANPFKTLNHHIHHLPKVTPDQARVQDWRYQILEMSDTELLTKVMTLHRMELLDWLQWNDPNGIYSDKDSIAEGIKPLSTRQAQAYVYHVVMRDSADWDGYMGMRYIKELEDFLG